MTTRAATDLLGEQASVFEPDRVPVEPVGRNPAGQPLRLAGGDAVQRGPQGLTEPHQSVDLSGGGQHDRGVRARTAAGLEQAVFCGGLKDPVQELDTCVSRDQPVRAVSSGTPSIFLACNDTDTLPKHNVGLHDHNGS
ncbi:hypothetical protein [Streptomyces noursei]|uniref:hypothetical protein n=1 Tax=Streptomyces noursei TaxID=1971 RepID=UPI0013520A65